MNWRLLPFLFTLLLAPQAVAAAERIASLDATATLSPPRTVTITEHIVYDLGDEPRHGIYRDIPMTYTRDGNRFSYHLKVSEVRMDGKPIPHRETESSGILDIRIGDPDKTTTGVHVFDLTYASDRILNFFPDHSELYWNVTGNEWEVPIEASSFTVEGVVPEQLWKTECFSGSFGSTEHDCSISMTTTSTVIKATRGFSEREGLTAVVGFVSDVFTPPTRTEELVGILRDNRILFAPVLALGIMLAWWYVRGRDPRQPTIIPEYEPPEDIRPIHADMVLSDGEVRTRGITATILDLARRGYLHIRCDEQSGIFGTKRTYTFVKKRKADASLSEDERALFIGLFDKPETDPKLAKDMRKLLGALKMEQLVTSSHLAKRMFQRMTSQDAPVEVDEDRAKIGDESRMDEIRDGMFPYNVEIARTKAWSQLSGKRVFVARPSEVRGSYFAVAMVSAFATYFGGLFVSGPGASVLAAFATFVIVYVIGHFMPRVTRTGAELIAHVKGFRWFLTVTEKERLAFTDAPERSPKQFHEFLPFAVAMGVEEKWAKQFVGIDMPPPDWADGQGWDHLNAMSFTSQLSSFGRSASTAFSPPPSQAGSGESGFSGGGSGGGGGGGGGGSW